MSTYRRTRHTVQEINMGYLSVFIMVNLCVWFCILIFDIQVNVVLPSFSGECISILGQCDGISACSDGRDELNSVCCTGRNNFECTSGECIRSYQRCDGVTRCSDGSDEMSCTICKFESVSQLSLTHVTAMHVNISCNLLQFV